MIKKRCFVISPIGEKGSKTRHHADAVFEFIIDGAMKKFQKKHEKIVIDTVRSDHILESGPISQRMFEEILKADFCVAVLTDHNPNVFYELAVAQAAARPLIILIQKGQDLPFDVQDLRCARYDLEDICELVEGRYAEDVRKHVQAICDQGWISKSLFERYGYGRQLRFEQQLRSMARKARPEPLPVAIDAVYRLPRLPEDRRIVLVTGDIMLLRELQGKLKERRHLKIDVIVSLEDANLQLARYFESSIPGATSGTLRYLAAKKSDAGEIEEDSLLESLRRAIEKEHIKPPATLGMVIPTSTTHLKEEGNGVQYVFHVAAMTGSVSDGYKMEGDLLDDCVRNVYRRFAKLAPDEGLETLLFPMLGAAATRLEPEEVALRLLRPIVNQMKRTEECRETYFLAWHEVQRFAVRKAAEALGLEEDPGLEEPAPAAVVTEFPSKKIA